MDMDILIMKMSTNETTEYNCVEIQVHVHRGVTWLLVI